MSTVTQALLWATGTLVAGVLLCFTQPKHHRAEFAVWCTAWQLAIWCALGFAWGLGWWSP